jgi:hypothetical protein
MRVMAVQVAQARLNPKGSFFEHEEAMGLVSGKRVRHAQLKRHIETRYPPRTPKAYPAEIVNGGTAIRDEAMDALQAILPGAGNLQNAVRLAPEDRQACDEGHEKPPIFRVEGNVEKDRVGGERGRHGDPRKKD